MPIYEYRCRNGHTFEVFQSMTDDPVASCERCGTPVERVFHPVAVHFKGSGFYTTDYARKGAKKSADDGGAKGERERESDSKPDKGPKPESGSGEKAKGGSDSD